MQSFDIVENNRHIILSIETGRRKNTADVKVAPKENLPPVNLTLAEIWVPRVKKINDIATLIYEV